MEQASLSGFIETILIILLIYFALKIIMRWYGPKIMNYFLKKMGQKMKHNFEQHTRNASSAYTTNTDGVEMTAPPKNTRKTKKDVGEYIDYEEID